MGLGMGAFDRAWHLLKQEPNSELARLHQRMDELIGEFNRLSDARVQMGASRELDLRLDQVVTEINSLEGQIAIAEQRREAPQYTQEELDYLADASYLFD